MRKTTLAASAALNLCAMRRDAESVPAQAMQRDITFEVRSETVNEETRTVELSFSSTAPYERWWGIEILDHGKKSVRLGRLNSGAALLMDHNTSDQVGVVEKAWIDGDQGRAVVRFSRSPRAEEIFQDVKDKIRTLVSVGYRVLEIILEKQTEGEASTYRVTDWEPYEISLVSVPADTSVGVGREGEPPAFDPRSLITEEETEDMNMRRDGSAGGPAPAIATPAAAPAAPAVDLAAVRAEERDRISQISAMGARLNCRDLADTAIANGTPLDAFIREYQAKAGPASEIRVAETPEIGLTAKERQRYSFQRLLNALGNPTDIQAREAAAFEFECSDAAMARGQAPGRQGAMCIPHDIVANQRDLVVGTATAGGHTVATDLIESAFIDLLRNRLAIEQVGSTVLADLNGNVAIPRQTGGATAYWLAESGASTESQQAFDQVTLTPKTVSGYTDYSRQLLLQSSMSVESFIRNDLSKIMALEIDRAAVNGSGSSNQPRGIINTSGIGSEAGGTNGLAPTWDNMINLETLVAVANADMGSLAYLTNAKARGKLKRTQKFATTNGDPIWGPGNEMNGYKAAVSNQVPSNLTKGTSNGVCSAILFGNFADLLVGFWGGLDVLVNPYILSGTGTVRVEVFQSCDITVRHPESFAAMLDALTV